MAEILPFERAATKRRARGRDVPGEVVIFTGVRVEYHERLPENSKRRQRRSRRRPTEDAISA
jgi:hypothetical protein